MFAGTSTNSLTHHTTIVLFFFKFSYDQGFLKDNILSKHLLFSQSKILLFNLI